MNAYPLSERREFQPMALDQLTAAESRLTAKIDEITFAIFELPYSECSRALRDRRRGMVGQRLGFRDRIAAAKRTMEVAR